MADYAIISLGGKQYRVREGDRLLVDRLPTGEGAEVADAAASENGDEPKPRKRTRRGSRGGRNRRKKRPAPDGASVADEEDPAASSPSAESVPATAPDGDTG